MPDYEKLYLGLGLLAPFLSEGDMVWSNDAIIFPAVTRKVEPETHSRLYELGFGLIEENASGEDWWDNHWIFNLSAHEKYVETHPYRPKKKK